MMHISPMTRRLRKRSREVKLSVVETLEDRTLLSTASARILNGVPTNKFPSVGIVGDTTKGFCTGTLITSRDVLTAAHCAEFLDDTDGSFLVGGTKYITAQVVVHPNYNPFFLGTDQANDLAILRFSKSITGITPSPLHTSPPQVGDVVTLVGFGSGGTDAGHDGTFGTKRLGTTQVDKVTPTLLNWFFDGFPESNTGPGDSGGPNFLRAGNQQFVLAAVTSGGAKADASLGDEAFNTRVDAYRLWIESVINAPLGTTGGGGFGVFGSGSLAFSSFGVNGLFTSGGGTLPFTPKLRLARPELRGVIRYSAVGNYYKFVAKQTGTIVIKMRALQKRFDPQMALYNGRGKLLRHNDDAHGTRHSLIRKRVVKGHTYYIAARGVGASTGRYELTVRFRKVTQPSTTTVFSTRSALASPSPTQQQQTQSPVNLVRSEQLGRNLPKAVPSESDTAMNSPRQILLDLVAQRSGNPGHIAQQLTDRILESRWGL